MAVSKAKKQEILAELKVKFSEATSVVFVKNNGLTVEEILGIRGELRKTGDAFKISKKTLIRLALKELELPEVEDDILSGPIGVAFGTDEISVAKTLEKIAKSNERLELMGGILEGKVLSRDDVVALAKMPSKEELLAKLVGSLKSPISGFHGVLHANLRGIVQVLDQIQKQKAEA